MDFTQKRWKCMIAAMTLALFTGIGYAWSVFQTPLINILDSKLQAISLTFTIQVIVSTFAPVVVGRFQKKIGLANYIRVGILLYSFGLMSLVFVKSVPLLYICFGLIVGTGMSMIYPCLMSYSSALFPEKTGFASGLLACAYGCGAVLWAPIATYLMKSNSVLVTFCILGVAFAIVMFPTSFFVQSVPSDFNPEGQQNVKKQVAHSIEEYSWQEMIKTYKYYFLLISLILAGTAGLMITGHAANMLQEIAGYTAESASVFVGLIAVFNALGRLVFGTSSDKFGRYNMMMLMFAIMATAMLVLTKASGLIFAIALFANSAAYGGFTSMVSPVCADNFGFKNLATNYNFIYIAYGFAGVIGPQLASYIKGESGGYTFAFLTVAVMSVVGFVLIFMLKLKSDQQKT